MIHTAPDFLILGGGVIGLSVAYHLGKQGATVTVLDANEPGQASSAAAGMLAPLAEASEPGPFLGLALDSLRRYPAFLAALRDAGGSEVSLQGPGMLRVARTDAEDAALCRALSWQPPLGLPLHRLTGAEARRLEPGLGGEVESAVLSPGEKHSEPRLLLAALTAACRAHGVEVTAHSPATRLETSAGRAHAAWSGPARHTFGTLVLAAGAWSRGVGHQLAYDIPVAPLRGQILALGPQTPAPFSHTLYNPRRVPRAARRRPHRGWGD